MTDNHEAAVSRHYGLAGLRAAIFEAISATGLSTDRLTPRDLAPVDEFHIGGRGATVDIVDRLQLAADDRVLDIGCGLGGLTRYIASEIGCRVSGVDLTPEYVEIAAELTRLTGLSARIEYKVGSALDLPFTDGEFDAATTFHVGMNIADRGTMVREAVRVIRPGGRLAVYDVMKGPKPGLLFPVPWAETAATSHLIAPADLSAHLRDVGFSVEYEDDRTDVALQHHRARLAASAHAKAPPALGLHLLQGGNAAEKSRNMIQMVEAGQIVVGLVIARRAD